MDKQFFNDFLYTYGLHDTEITDIFIEDNKVVFCFGNGVYQLDSTGRETELTVPCKMYVDIYDFNVDSIWEHIQIYKKRKNKIKEVKWEDFVKDLRKNRFEIYKNWYSPFNNGIKLEIDWYTVTITEVKSVSFIFDK